MYNIVLINNSRTAFPPKIVLKYLSVFSDNVLDGTYTIFQNSVGNVKIMHRTCIKIGSEVQFPLKMKDGPFFEFAFNCRSLLESIEYRLRKYLADYMISVDNAEFNNRGLFFEINFTKRK